MMTSFERKYLTRMLVFGLIVTSAMTQAVAQQTITPTAKELNKSFDTDMAQWAERFEHEGRAVYDKRFEILDAMGLKPGMDVADIGAGSGLFSRLIALRVAPEGAVFAVDISKNMVDHIAKTAQGEKITNLKDFKRIEGISRDYILKMVRAGEGTFTDEFLNAGFELIERRDDMFPENYLLKFKHRRASAKPARAAEPRP